VLVIGAEVFSRILEFQDRTTCVLFGDGAGAVVMSASEEPGILACTAACGRQPCRHPVRAGQPVGGAIAGSAFLYMDGPAVFKLACRAGEGRP
jgi:3-oxoacyl-[acyl-carrier-protein] synthase-3